MSCAIISGLLVESFGVEGLGEVSLSSIWVWGFQDILRVSG